MASPRYSHPYMLIEETWKMLEDSYMKMVQMKFSNDIKQVLKNISNTKGENITVNRVFLVPICLVCCKQDSPNSESNMTCSGVIYLLLGITKINSQNIEISYRGRQV